MTPQQEPHPTTTTTPRRPIGPLAVELRQAVMRTSRRLRQERSTDDVTPGQYSVLAGLDVLGPLTPRELAAREKVQPPSMTRTLAALEELGLVSRTDHPTDGRQVLMGLTPEGVTVVKETRKRRDAWLAQRLAELGPDERETLHQAAEILARVAAS
ncbi:MarR family transcriptional regulator [Angustibacter peucedani]